MKPATSVFAKIKIKFRRIFIFEPLSFFARLVIKKRKVKIVGVTGSLGKTTTVNFVYTILKSKFPNTYLSKDLATGTPTYLSIFNYEPVLELRKQIFGLFVVFFKTIFILLNKKHPFPTHLILELRCYYDGKSLLLITKKLKPDIRIITAVELVHTDNLGDIPQIASRKRVLIECACTPSHFAVLNYDDPYVRKMAKYTKANIIFYGLNPGAQVKADNIKISEKGLTFTLEEKNHKNIFFNLPGISDKVHLYSILPAIIVGRIYKMSWEEITKAARKIKPVEGRGNLVCGIKNSIIINSTFNANLRSMKAAIHSLQSFAIKRRKVAVLGSMLELGKFSDYCHQEVGKIINDRVVNYLITVGKETKLIAETAIKFGFNPKNIHQFENADQAIKQIKPLIQENDVILVKASNDMNLNKLVESLKEI